MKNFFRKTVILSSAFMLALATVVCCNMAMAKAGGDNVSTGTMDKSMPACHSHRTKPSSPVQSDCNCCLTKKFLQSDSLTKISFYHPSQVILGYAPISVLPQPCSVVKSSYNLAFLDGPPGPLADSPLYIHFRSIRI